MGMSNVLVKLSLVFALATSAQEVPLMEQRGDISFSIWILHWSFYPWLCPFEIQGRKERVRDGHVPIDENSRSSLDERSQNRNTV